MPVSNISVADALYDGARWVLLATALATDRFVATTAIVVQTDLSVAEETDSNNVKKLARVQNTCWWWWAVGTDIGTATCINSQHTFGQAKQIEKESRTPEKTFIPNVLVGLKLRRFAEIKFFFSTGQKY